MVSSSVRSDIFYAPSDSLEWEPLKMYDCPRGYKWISTSEAIEIFGEPTSWSRDKDDDSYKRPFYDKYKFSVGERFRFSDSKTTGAYKRVGQDVRPPMIDDFTMSGVYEVEDLLESFALA